jgi:hypothetical protein
VNLAFCSNPGKLRTSYHATTTAVGNTLQVVLFRGIAPAKYVVESFRRASPSLRFHNLIETEEILTTFASLPQILYPGAGFFFGDASPARHERAD